jgi:hypothetical protein
VEANQDNYREKEAYDQKYRNDGAGVRRNLAYDFERIAFETQYVYAETVEPLYQKQGRIDQVLN